MKDVLFLNFDALSDYNDYSLHIHRPK